MPTASSLLVLTAKTTADPTASSIIPHMMTQEFTSGSMNLLRGRVALLDKTSAYTNITSINVDPLMVMILGNKKVILALKLEFVREQNFVTGNNTVTRVSNFNSLCCETW
jgi:hypothetical protein